MIFSKIWATIGVLCLLLPFGMNSTPCLDLEEGCCDYSATDNSLRCSGVKKLVQNANLRELTLCNYPENVFDVTDVISFFPKLETFTLMTSNVTVVRGEFPQNSSLKVLNFTDLVIEKIRSHVFADVSSLRVLDLRNNRLIRLHIYVINIANRLQKLFLQGNEWDCGLDLDWVLFLNESVVQDMRNLTCFNKPYPYKPLKPVATFLSNLKLECPKLCKCTMPNLVAIPVEKGGGLIPVIQVNCSGLGLKKYPETLPQNTTILHLQRNSLTNVDALRHNKFYRRVADIFLDYNNISSIDELEGAYWLSHFRVFSLKGNLLTQVPTYALDNALERNQNAVRIFLGENPWRCDCQFTPSFQDILVKYEALMTDKSHVRCATNKDDENSLMPIIKLSRSAVCRDPDEPSVHFLDLLNGVLASLIVFILGKLAYDYYKFKRTGQLPWIVTKIS